MSAGMVDLDQSGSPCSPVKALTLCTQNGQKRPKTLWSFGYSECSRVKACSLCLSIPQDPNTLHANSKGCDWTAGLHSLMFALAVHVCSKFLYCIVITNIFLLCQKIRYVLCFISYERSHFGRLVIVLSQWIFLHDTTYMIICTFHLVSYYK